MTQILNAIHDITQRIIERSSVQRQAYLKQVETQKPNGTAREKLSAGNQAHAYAGCAVQDKKNLLGKNWANIGIVTSYNDMLSAHAPYEKYPEIIKQEARRNTATAQVAGGVPAMCDGVTQGTTGMELSLFSRDVIAMSTAVALSHNTYDAALYLGICDKIVPGLLIGALSYGHIPGVFIPAGPMPSGLPNKEKVRIRQLYAEGKIDREALLKAEMESYHSQGTCTFYGTANSNQMLMEIGGLHLPGAAFVQPNSNIREKLTEAAVRQAINITHIKGNYTPIAKVVSEKTIVNMIVGLMATGGSTNHALHLPAIAAAAGITLTWDDMDEISKAIPLLAKIYPNGQADINHFHLAGGMGLIIRQLLDAGMLHDDVTTIMGDSLYTHTEEAVLDDDQLIWQQPPAQSIDPDIIAKIETPFQPDGGLCLIQGPIGRGVMKTSAVSIEHQNVKAAAEVFECQDAVLKAFQKGDLNKDVIIVLRFQGPSANGMPELHKLMPALGVLQDKGYKVALVTDGRLSGASGKVPAVIHISPEAKNGGAIAKIQSGDVIEINASKGSMTINIDQEIFAARDDASQDSANTTGMGRELFQIFRTNCKTAEEGGGVFGGAT